MQRRAPGCSAHWVIRLLTVLQQEGRIDEELIRKLLGWRRSGFSVQNEVRVGSQDVAGRRRVAESILRSSFSQERGRTPREKPAYPLTPTYPIAGETDRIITVVELSKIMSDPGERRSIPNFPNTLGVEISQDLNTIRIHTTGNDPAIPER